MSEISFLLRSMELNEVLRAGWVDRGVEDPQDVAGHSWGVSFLTMLYAGEAEDVDPEKALQMAVIHDLPESEVGDTIEGNGRSVERSRQFREERRALEKIVDGSTFGERLIELWTDFENRASKEAVFVRDMDKIDMCLQALRYSTSERYDPAEIPSDNDGLEEFFESAESTVRTDVGRTLFEDIYREYESKR